MLKPLMWGEVLVEILLLKIVIHPRMEWRWFRRIYQQSSHIAQTIWFG